MKNNQTSYQHIMKATSIFGGVQVFNILIAIIRSKFIAVLLGPTGMGISGLLNSSIGLISSITNFGLHTSAVKNIAEANGSGDTIRIATIVGVFRKLIWITGLLGAILMLILASRLSDYTFGNRDYTFAFIWLAISLLLNQISSGQKVLLQGMRRIKLMAKASLIASTLGLFITIPIYYYWGLDGIVPNIILTSCLTLLVFYFFSRKVKIDKIAISLRTTMYEGKGMLVMGFFIGLTAIMDQIVEYATRIFISNQGGVDEVGLFNAGFVIVNTYVGMIFAAMMTDYYPRLSAVAHDNKASGVVINQQAEIAVLILAPMVILFLVFIKVIVIALYSEKFISIDKMIYWAMLGVLFKALNWSIGIIVLAKGATKLYLFTYIIAVIIVLSTNIGGYYYFGLEGLGIAFLVTNFLLTLSGIVICGHLYAFVLSPELIKVFGIQFLLSLSCFIVMLISNSPLNYFIGIILFLTSFFYSFKELDKRIGIKPIIISIKNRFKRQ